MVDPGRVAARIRTLVARQHGHITRTQLLDLGLSERAISHRIRAGSLIVVHAGAYAVEYPRPEPLAKAAAAVLACGEGAALSHSSAAVLWGMRKGWTSPPEVTTPTKRRRPRIRTHRCTTLTRRDLRHHQGLPVTSPARTALDLAPRLTASELARAVNDGRLAGYLHLAELAELLSRQPRHPGALRTREILQASRAAPTRSVFEDEFVAFARRYELPEPQINAHVAGYEVDVLFRIERVIVELDGFDYHRDRRSFERDRERDAATLAAGCVTVRITWTRWQDLPEREAARLHQILRSRRGVGRGARGGQDGT